MIHRLKHEKIQWGCIDFYPFFSNATLLKIFNNLLAWSLHYSLLSKLSIVAVSKNDDMRGGEQISINLTYNILGSESRFLHFIPKSTSLLIKFTGSGWRVDCEISTSCILLREGKVE